MFVIVNKANHTFFGMIFELCSNFEESSFVKISVIGFVCQDWVITPDDLFFPNEVGEAFEGVYSLSKEGRLVSISFP